MRPVSPRRIADAAGTIDPVFRATPLVRETPLDRVLGVRLALKVETLNPIRSFKGRGTEFLVAELLAGRAGDDRTVSADRPPHLVCASAGNFGQGLARAGARRGARVTVFAAVGANALKVAAMRALGAVVHLAGADFDAAKDAARAYVAAAPAGEGARYVEDGAWPEIAEGAGTIGLELTEALAAPGEAPEVVLLPVGNGALATGVGAWFRHAAPSTRIVGVVAAGAPSMQRSFAAGRAVATPAAHTIADGIAVREPVPYAVAAMAATIDEVVAVDDAAVVRAMRLVHEHVGLVVEPSGVVGVAALLGSDVDAAGGDAGRRTARWRGARIATPLCGGNLTPEQARTWLCG
jgi:threonine dehydratase